MKENNIIQEKSFSFAIRIVKVYKYLVSAQNEYVLSKQLLRSGTSIGANIEESIGGQSTADFLSKISISYKEARESIYWIKIASVIRNSQFLIDKLTLPLRSSITRYNVLLAMVATAHKRAAFYVV